LADPHAQIGDADEAARLLAHPILAQAFETLEREYLDALLKCSERDDIGRFRLVEAMKTVSAVRRHLSTVVDTGKIARKQLAELEGRRFL
jgi:hypothetical protein